MRAAFRCAALALAATAVAGTVAAQDSAARLQRGIELLNANQIEAAIAELTLAVEGAPQNPAGRYHLGRALHAAGRHAEAVEHLSSGLPNAVDPSAFRLVMGQALIELGRLTEARAALDAADASRPDYPPIQYQLARVCYRAGNVEAALERFSRTAAMAPNWTAPRLQAGSIATEAGLIDAAAGFFRAALEIEPGRPLIWIRLGDALAAELDYAGAVDAYTRAVETAPDLQPARLALAYLHFNRQRFDAAAAALVPVLERWPDDPQGLLPLGEIQMIEGRHEEALATLDAALRALDTAASPPGAPPNPLRTRAQELRAKTLLNLSRWADAEAVARELLANDPANLDGMFVLGTALVRSGNADGREHLRAFQRLSNVREHLELAVEYYRRAADPVRARAEFEKALAIDPQDRRALTGLGTVLRALDDFAGALETLAAARRAGADGPEWYREWVLTLAAAGRGADAEQAWQEARGRGFSLGPSVWAAVGAHRGAC